MAGFGKDQVKNLDPTAMAGFGKDQIKNIDAKATAGFKKDQVKNLDAEAVTGFKREQVTSMTVDAMSGFEAKQVKNLEASAKKGMGDKVKDFKDFDIDVKKELVQESKMLLGGVGSFEELAKEAANKAATANQAELKSLGWDKAAEKIAAVSFGAASKAAGTSAIPASAVSAIASIFGGTGSFSLFGK